MLLQSSGMEVEGFADDAFYEVTKGMPPCQRQNRICFLQQCSQKAAVDIRQDVTHRPKYDPEAAGRVRARRKDPDVIQTLFCSKLNGMMKSERSNVTVYLMT